MRWVVQSLNHLFYTLSSSEWNEQQQQFDQQKYRELSWFLASSQKKYCDSGLYFVSLGECWKYDTLFFMFGNGIQIWKSLHEMFCGGWGSWRIAGNGTFQTLHFRSVLTDWVTWPRYKTCNRKEQPFYRFIIIVFIPFQAWLFLWWKNLLRGIRNYRRLSVYSLPVCPNYAVLMVQLTTLSTITVHVMNRGFCRKRIFIKETSPCKNDLTMPILTCI